MSAGTDSDTLEINELKAQCRRLRTRARKAMSNDRKRSESILHMIALAKHQNNCDAVLGTLELMELIAKKN